MVYVEIYLILGYIVVLAIAILVWRYVLPERRLKVTSVVIGTSIILSLPILPYVYVEGQTLLFCNNLRESTKKAVHDTYYDDKVVMLKVLRFSSARARVYVVTKINTAKKKAHYGPQYYRAFIIDIARNGKEWTRVGDWDCIWSDLGSANGNIFPPYPSKGDYK